jgi:serine/threonine protein kinase
MSASFSPELSQLLTGLLQKDPGQRLGCRGRGSEEVKECSFFANTNWDDVLARKVCKYNHIICLLTSSRVPFCLLVGSV